MGPHDIPVVEQESLDEDTYGIFNNFPDMHIAIHSKLAGKIRNSTILHEAIHAISSIYSVGLKEQQVRLLEVALIQFVYDNPKFIKKLS